MQRFWVLLVIGLLTCGAGNAPDICKRVDCGTWDIPEPSQPPAPGGGHTEKPDKATSEQPAPNPQPEKRGSVELPWVIQSVFTKEEAKQQADDRDEKSTNDVRLLARGSVFKGAQISEIFK